MMIDFSTHVMPHRTFAMIEGLPLGFGTMAGEIHQITSLYDMDTRFRIMDEYATVKQLISLSSPAIEEVATPQQTAEIVRVANDEMAELVHHPDRFLGFLASLDLENMDGALRELDRAIDECGALGIQLSTQIRDIALDDPRFDPVFAAIARRGVPLLIHPTRPQETPDFGGESGSLFGVWQSLGWPYMTSAIMWRLICRGLFDRYPEIKIVTHHLGGNIPYHSARIEGGLQRNLDAIDSERRRDGLPLFQKRASEYLRMFYADMAMHGALAPIICGISFFGIDNVLFASDMPFGSVTNAMAAFNKLELQPAAREQIGRGNAEKLFSRAS
jgi:predicted TIM-barrel fold metal-dependent hydrolase